jgi:hypothetical protein
MTADAIPVVEVDRAAPLTDRSAGRFRSPLSGEKTRPVAKSDQPPT